MKNKFLLPFAFSLLALPFFPVKKYKPEMRSNNSQLQVHNAHVGGGKYEQ